MIEFDTLLKRKIVIYNKENKYVVEIKAWDEETGDYTDSVHVKNGKGVIIGKQVTPYSVYQEFENNELIIVEHFTTCKFKTYQLNGIIMIEGIK